MTDLMKALDMWPERRAQTLADRGELAEYAGGRGYDEQRAFEDGADDMLALLSDVIEAADAIHTFKIEGAWDQSEWVRAQHALHDALAALREKVSK